MMKDENGNLLQIVEDFDVIDQLLTKYLQLSDTEGNI
jgi:hypothetical protein